MRGGSAGTVEGKKIIGKIRIAEEGIRDAVDGTYLRFLPDFRRTQALPGGITADSYRSTARIRFQFRRELAADERVVVPVGAHCNRSFGGGVTEERGGREVLKFGGEQTRGIRYP